MEYLDNKIVERYKSCLINLLDKFIAFCDKNSLNYFCAGGTTLGAVRHHGFIPWDDDIDLFMIREDYNKLLSLKRDLEEIGIGLEGIQSSDEFAVFLKIWDLNTTMWELEEIPFVYGVYIDIFPLDYTDDTVGQFVKKYKLRRKLCFFYQMSLIKFSFRTFIRRITQRDSKFVVKGIMSLFVPHCFSRIIRNRILKEDLKEQNESGMYLVSYYGDYWDKEYYKSEWFKNFKLVDFESLRVRIPVGYQEYLTQIYHDFMKLPPKEKQRSHHYHYYLNLDIGMNIDEIRRELKK